jgi:translation initiation factor IF-3
LQGKSVRLVTEGNDEPEIVSFSEASERAREAGLDTVVVAETADPVVIRLIDICKLRYELNRKLKDQKKRQKVQKNKEIKFHVNVDTHDFNLKVKHIVEFLEKGYKVRASLYFRGREMAHRDMGMELMGKIIEAVGELATIDAAPKMNGRIISTQMSPAKSK